MTRFFISTVLFTSLACVSIACSAPVEPPAEPASEGSERGESIREDDPSPDAGCERAGCSGQICAEAGREIMTTCEFRPEYACYRDAVCERQEDGECGFTETQELRDCLSSPPPLE